MKWVTRDHVHLDRVASPWLIKRFIDRDAEFLFIPAGSPVPGGAVPFGLPGVELSSHDASGSTFRKLLRKYALADAALDMIADMIDSGIAHFFAKNPNLGAHQGAIKMQEGVGLEALSWGMIFFAESDRDNIEKSEVIYDALYKACRATLVERENPSLAKMPFAQRSAEIKRLLKAAVR